MERPDLQPLAAQAQAIYEALADLDRAFTAAYDAALGEADPDTDEELAPPSGDSEGFFEEGRAKLRAARYAVNEAQTILATVQGYRDFADAGVVESA